MNILLRKDKFLFGHCILVEDVTCVATSEATTNVCVFAINNVILFTTFHNVFATMVVESSSTIVMTTIMPPLSLKLVLVLLVLLFLDCLYRYKKFWF